MSKPAQASPQRKRKAGPRSAPGGVTVQARLESAIHALAQRLPLDQIDAAKIAREAQVSWPTVRRYLGDQEQLQKTLEQLYPGQPNSTSTRERLLQAAATVFAEQGFTGATLDQVSAAAGLTKGAIYWHFKNKAELFVALMQARDLRMQDLGLEEIQVALATGNLEEALAQLLAQQLNRLLGDEVHLRLYVEFLAAARDDWAKEQLAAGYQRQLQLLTALISGIRDQGLLAPPANVATLAQLLLLLFDGFVMMARVDPQRARSEDLAPQLARVLLQGLQPYLPR